jgi:hypothetical protein
MNLEPLENCAIKLGLYVLAVPCAIDIGLGLTLGYWSSLETSVFRMMFSSLVLCCNSLPRTYLQQHHIGVMRACM